jgi:hypothetical protein
MKNPADTAIVFNAFQLAFGLSVTFYITGWVELMSFNWTYGMMAFLQVFSFLLLVLLFWKGHDIRQGKVGVPRQSEGGEHVLEKLD